MGVNRFFNRDFGNYIDQFVPLPLQEIAQAGANKQNVYDKGMESALEESKPIVGGNVTKDQASELNKKIHNDISSMVQDAQKSDNYNQLQYKIKDYANNLRSNPIYQGIELDKQLSPIADKQTLDQGFSDNVQNFYDPKTKSYKQLDVNTPFSAGVYSSVTPGDPQKEFKPYYDQLQDVIKQTYGDNIEQQVNQDGSITLIQDGVKTVGSISKDELRNIANNLQDTDPNFKTLQSFNYAKAKNEQQFGGPEHGNVWDKNDNSELFVNNYLKNKHDETQIQKIVGNIKAPKGGSGRSGSGEGSSSGELPNDIMKMHENLDRSHDGTTSIDNFTAGAVLGGTYSKADGYTTIHVNSDTPTFLSIPSKISGVSNPKDGVEISKAIPYQQKINQIRNGFKDVLQEATSNGSPWIDPKTGNDYFMDTNGIIHENTLQKAGDNSHYQNNKLSLDQFIQKQDIYNQVNKDALNNGVNLNDPKYRQALKTKNPDDLKALNEVALNISNLQGDYNFVTDPNSKNAFTGSDGNEYISGYIIADEDELSNILPQDFIDGWGTSGYKKAITLGVIDKLPMKSKDGVVRYKVPMIRKSESNIDDMVSNQMLSKYGDSKTVLDQIKGKQDEARSYKQDRVDRIDTNNFIGLYKNDGVNTQNKVRENIKSIFKDNIDIQNKFDDQYTQIITSNESSENKAKALYLLNLNAQAATGDPDAMDKYNRLYSKFTGGNDVGKSQEEWTKTPSNPLR